MILPRSGIKPLVVYWLSSIIIFLVYALIINKINLVDKDKYEKIFDLVFVLINIGLIIGMFFSFIVNSLISSTPFVAYGFLSIITFILYVVLINKIEPRNDKILKMIIDWISISIYIVLMTGMFFSFFKSSGTGAQPIFINIGFSVSFSIVLWITKGVLCIEENSE